MKVRNTYELRLFAGAFTRHAIAHILGCVKKTSANLHEKEKDANKQYCDEYESTGSCVKFICRFV